MCIKIIGSQELEFDISKPLIDQISDAKEIIVSYDPLDPKINSFVGQVEVMVRNGVTCQADIEVNSNNYLDGIRLERVIEKLKRKLEVNEVIKGLSKFHTDTDNKLCEMSEMCLGKK